MPLEYAASIIETAPQIALCQANHAHFNKVFKSMLNIFHSTTTDIQVVLYICLNHDKKIAALKKNNNSYDRLL